MTYGAKKDSALEHFEKAVKLNPESAITRIEYANGLILLFGKGKIDDATSLYEEAAAMKPHGRDGAAGRRAGEVGARIGSALEAPTTEKRMQYRTGSAAAALMLASCSPPAPLAQDKGRRPRSSARAGAGRIGAASPQRSTR